MAEFLTTTGAEHYIEDIVSNAHNRLVLICPYLKLSKTWLERLRDADRRNVKIFIVCGKEELKSDVRKQLQQLKNLELFFFENLHAKCYFNEERMVITSWNMYDSSHEKNREMGILLHANGDKDILVRLLKKRSQ